LKHGETSQVCGGDEVSGKRAVAEMDGTPELVLGGTSTGNKCDFNKSTDELPFLSSLSKVTEKKHAKIGYVFLVDLHTLYIWMEPVSHICCLKPQ